MSIMPSTIARRLANSPRLWCPLLIAMGGMLLSSSGWGDLVHGQDDTVITRRKNSSETVKRRGTITDWKGFAITIATNVGEKKIENDEIVEVQTNWQPSYVAGLKSLESGDLTTAIDQLRAALNSETRNWAQRIIRADLVRAYQASENPLAAVEQFLAITAEDPQTRFIHLCPLRWLPSNAVMSQPAQVWLKSNDPVRQLIGASWLLRGPQQQAAIQVLDELSRDIDANIKYLAIAQLWLTRNLNVNARQIEVWEKLLESMPQPIRAGPWLVLAEAQSRADQVDEAAINLLRIPILYPKQIGLSAAALYRAGHLLHNTGRSNEAQTVWNELRQKHPHSTWAQQAPVPDANANPKR